MRQAQKGLNSVTKSRHGVGRPRRAMPSCMAAAEVLHPGRAVKYAGAGQCAVLWRFRLPLPSSLKLRRDRSRCYDSTAEFLGEVSGHGV